MYNYDVLGNDLPLDSHETAVALLPYQNLTSSLHSCSWQSYLHTVHRRHGVITSRNWDTSLLATQVNMDKMLTPTPLLVNISFRERRKRRYLLLPPPSSLSNLVVPRGQSKEPITRINLQYAWPQTPSLPPIPPPLWKYPWLGELACRVSWCKWRLLFLHMYLVLFCLCENLSAS